MQSYITTVGNQLLTKAVTTETTLDISGAVFGSALISGLSASTLVDLTSVSGLVYTAPSSAITYSITNSNTITFRITLGTSIGNFDIGNFGLVDSNGNLITITALDSTQSKTNASSSSGENQLIYTQIVTFQNIESAINVTIEDNSVISTLETVATTADLPTPSTSAYNAIIVTSDPNAYGYSNLYVMADSNWVGLTPLIYGQFASENLTTAATAYKLSNSSTNTYPVVNDAAAGSTSLLLVGSIPYINGYTYTLTGTGISSDTTVTNSVVSEEAVSYVDLSSATTATIPFGESLTVTENKIVSSSSTYALEADAASGATSLTVFGSITLADDTTYTLSGDNVTASTHVTAASATTASITELALSVNTTANIPAYTSITIEIGISTDYTVNAAAASGSNSIIVPGEFVMTSGHTYTVSGTGIAVGTTISSVSYDATNAQTTLVLSEVTTAAIAADADITIEDSSNSSYYTYTTTELGASTLALIGDIAYNSTESYLVTGTGIGASTSITNASTSTVTACNLTIDTPLEKDATTGETLTIASYSNTVISTNTYETANSYSSGVNILALNGSISIDSDYTYYISGTGIASNTTIVSSTISTIQNSTITLSNPTSAAISAGATVTLTLEGQSITNYGLLTDLLNLKLNTADLPSYNFATQSWVSSTLGDYATKAWVEGGGYTITGTLTVNGNLTSSNIYGGGAINLYYGSGNTYRAALQSDGNFVLYKGDTSFFSAQDTGINMTGASSVNVPSPSSSNGNGAVNVSYLNGQNYATQGWVSGQSYATQSWVNSQGFITTANNSSGTIAGDGAIVNGVWTKVGGILRQSLVVSITTEDQTIDFPITFSQTPIPTVSFNSTTTNISSAWSNVISVTTDSLVISTRGIDGNGHAANALGTLYLTLDGVA